MADLIVKMMDAFKTADANVPSEREINPGDEVQVEEKESVRKSLNYRDGDFYVKANDRKIFVGASPHGLGTSELESLKKNLDPIIQELTAAVSPLPLPIYRNFPNLQEACFNYLLRTFDEADGLKDSFIDISKLEEKAGQEIDGTTALIKGLTESLKGYEEVSAKLISTIESFLPDAGDMGKMLEGGLPYHRSMLQLQQRIRLELELEPRKY